MKKLFVCALAVGMFTACSQEETLSTQAPTQISFAGAFVENATRVADPSITTDNIEDFDVWGYMQNTDGMIFNREKVTKSGDVWSYANTQYWVPGKEYRFMALAPAQSKNITVTELQEDPILANVDGLGMIEFTNIEGSEDLLFAMSKVYKYDQITEQPEDVKFTFDHMLAKVKFSFTNGFTNDNTTLKVSNVVMSVPQKGKIDTGTDTWRTDDMPWQLINPETRTSLNFSGVADTPAEGGNASGVIEIPATETIDCANERLTIPASKDQEYKVTFMVEMYQGGVLAITSKKEAVITGVELDMGKAYNFIAELNASNISETGALYPITFAVEEVNEWTPATATEVLDDYTVEAGEELVLVADGTINGTLNVKGTLNGAGHTLNAAEEPTSNILANISNSASIKNVTIKANNQNAAGDKGLRAFYINATGEYTLSNVTTSGVRYALNASAATKVSVVNSTLEGWTSLGGGVEGVFENVNFNVNEGQDDAWNGNLKPYADVTLKNCTFEEGFYLDFCEFKGTQIRMINCYYGETLITKDNIASLFGNNLEGIGSTPTDLITGEAALATLTGKLFFQ